jgi:hypothetical protein
MFVWTDLKCDCWTSAKSDDLVRNGEASSHGFDREPLSSKLLELRITVPFDAFWPFLAHDRGYTLGMRNRV